MSLELPSAATELRVLLVTLAMLFVPGWALLCVRRAWRSYAPLEAWAVAASLGVAFWPILFFLLRVIAPGVALGRGALVVLLLALGLIASAALRREALATVRFAGLEWLALGVVLVTLGTRVWVAHVEPFPAWSDSLHHVLLTELTARHGRLPSSLEPYFPVSVDRYHLGLYALTGTLQLLADVPAHTATLWLAQVLNGLCGLGVYLVLDRRVGRVPAVIGAVCAGLVSHQPAFYVNWGRFTQLAAQTIVLPAWLVAWDALRAAAGGASSGDASEGDATSGDAARAPASLFATALHACLLVAGVFLLHFRVALFLVPLLAATFAAELWRVRAAPQARHRLLLVAALLALAAGALAAPGMVRAVHGYVAGHWAAAQFRGGIAAPDGDRLTGDPEYFSFSVESIAYLFAGPATIAVVLALAAVAVVRRSTLACLTVVWVVALLALGEAHRLRVPFLQFTNVGAVLIALYLPASLLVATGVHELLGWLRAGATVRRAVLLLFLVLGALGARDRVTQLEPHRFFVTPADLRAMAWIRENTPPDAMFAVRTMFWLPGFPHGTDAGYWIPYLTNRRTTAGSMLSSLSPRMSNWGREVSKRVLRVQTTRDDDEAMRFLLLRGVRYFYLGARGDPADAERIAASRYARLRYAEDGVTIFELDPMPMLDGIPKLRELLGR